MRFNKGMKIWGRNSTAERINQVMQAQLALERARREAAEEAAAKVPQRRVNWTIVYTGITSLAAVGALVFTGLSLQQTRAQNAIAEQGQVTDRYTAAINQLGSQVLDIRLGGIYALQSVMNDSPPEQPSIVNVLSAFIRDHPPGRATPTKTTVSFTTPSDPPTDISAALSVLYGRDTRFDDGSVIDLAGTNLADVNLEGANLSKANLIGANLTGTDLSGADLQGADLEYVDASGSVMGNADLSGANLNDGNFSEADLEFANLNNAIITIEPGLFSAVKTNGAYASGTVWCSRKTPWAGTPDFLCNTMWIDSNLHSYTTAP